MKFPTIFINHGGGPLPLMGRQPALVENMKDIVTNHLPKEEPKAIVILSAHWESNPIKISSSPNPKMYYDYRGFPPETYEYDYPAPGSPDLAQRIQNLLGDMGLTSELDPTRGYDHGVFVPLMIMYPQSNIPVVCVSLDNSLDAEANMKIGSALAPLREDGILIMGSGFSFHNMGAFFNPSVQTVKASMDFNMWLKDTILNLPKEENRLEKLRDWDKAPGARTSHPREEHLIPLLMVAAAGGNDSQAKLIYDTTVQQEEVQIPADPQGTRLRLSEHAVTGYLFE